MILVRRKKDSWDRDVKAGHYYLVKQQWGPYKALGLWGVLKGKPFWNPANFEIIF